MFEIQITYGLFTLNLQQNRRVVLKKRSKGVEIMVFINLYTEKLFYYI